MKLSHRRALDAMQHLARCAGKPNQFVNPVPRSPRPKAVARSVKGRRSGLPERFVHLNDLVSSQRCIASEKLKAQILREKSNDERPLAVYYSGKWHLIDGNHRVAAYLLKSRMKMRMRTILVE